MDLKAGSSDNLAMTKVEEDIDRHVLSTKVKLSDGTMGTVFSRGNRNEVKVFLYNCHLCGVPNLPGERCLQTHIAGRKHQTKLTQTYIDAETFRAPISQKNKIQMQIAPGEPVPPGFENEVKLVAEIQSALDKSKDEPYVGLEYVMELTGGLESSYHCILCDKRGDPRTILIHFASYNHRVKFLEKHYPSVIRELGPFRYNKDAKPVLVKVVQTVCAAIEDTHGRLTPSVHDRDEYEKNKIRYLTEVINDKHFDEKSGPKFLNLVDKQKITDAIRRSKINSNLRRRDPTPPVVFPPGKKIKIDLTKSDRKSLDSVSSISSSSIHSRSRSRSPVKDVENRPVRRYRPELRYSRSRSASPTRYHRRSQSPLMYRSSEYTRRFDKSPYDRKKHSRERTSKDYERRERQSSPGHSSSAIVEKRLPLPTPKELSQQASKITQERYKWEKYRCLVEISVNDLDKILKEHEKNPEKHPLYPEEWKKFWNRRYKELQGEKKDPSKHDFKPEWIEFWTHRMKELHNEDIDKKKKEIRDKLGLPEEKLENNEKIIFATQKSIDHGSRDKHRSHSPWSDDINHRARSRSKRSRTPEKQSPSRSKRSRSRSRKRSLSKGRRSLSREKRSISPHHSYGRPLSREHLYERDRERHRRPLTGAPPDPYYNYDEWAKNYYGPHKSRPIFIRGNPDQPPTVAYEDDPNEPLTVVSVLRLLTALEDHLGSLGPKIVDMLARALALEKVKANSADEMLLNEDNCVFFETVKEKLKGQIIAGVIEHNKIYAVKKAIKNIAKVVHQITEKSKETKPENETKVILIEKPVPVITAIPGSSTMTSSIVDKTAIAQKIATALIAQGKTDVTNDQLEQLINVFVGMVQASKDSNHVISAASYLAEKEKGSVSEITSVELSSINNIEKSTPAKLTDDIRLSSIFDMKKPLEDDSKEDMFSSDPNALESLTDSDLQTLLQNFKDLSSEEQHHLISYLKKLEATDPNRVEKLRKFVNLEGERDKNSNPMILSSIVKSRDNELNKSSSSAASYFFDDSIKSNKNDRQSSPSPVKPNLALYDSEDDDDDYNFDDVVKAASKNVKDKQLQDHMRVVQESFQKERDDELSNTSKNSNSETSNSLMNTFSLQDTQNLIANIMGSLQKNVSRVASSPASASMMAQPPTTNINTANSNETNTQIPQGVADINDVTRQQQINMNNLPYYQQQQGSQQPGVNYQHQQQSQMNYGGNLYRQSAASSNTGSYGQQQQFFQNYGQYPNNYGGQFQQQSTQQPQISPQQQQQLQQQHPQQQHPQQHQPQLQQHLQQSQLQQQRQQNPWANNYNYF